MDPQEKIMNLVLEKKVDEAVNVFKQTPIFDYTSKKPLIKYEYFEFSKAKKKNAIFLRILLNYISLINLLNDLNIEDFQGILLKFCAKFALLNQKEGFFKLILMAKSSLEVYNIFFQKGKEMLNNFAGDINEVDWNDVDLKAIGYTPA